ncbi:MAG: hypothetical protein EXS24_00145 [Pedosphaera sp.]|nr:hypothetical protein [Pedosphaera sp.]
MKPVAPLPARFLLGLALIAANSLWAKSPPLNAGVAEMDITPHVGFRMAGYFNERLATGTHDPLKAKAIVLRDGGEKFAFAFCDLVGLSLHVTTNARAQFSKASGIPVSHIMIAATHSHTGPSFDDVRRDYFHGQALAKLGKDPQEQYDYADFLTERLVKVLRQANEHLAPATVSIGIAKQENLAFNRRYHMKNGRVAFNPGQLNPNIVKPAGPADSDVPLLFVQPADASQPSAGLTVFACHSDTIGGTEFSADYAFYLQETLRKTFGEKFISAFGAGTCGDINHINTGIKEEKVKGFDVAERIGTTLGRTVIAAQKNLTPILKPRFAVKSKTLIVPLKEVTPEQVAAARVKLKLLEGGDDGGFMEKVDAVRDVDLGNRGKTLPMEVQVFRLDSDTAIVGLPGEIFVELGLAIKQASPFKRTMVISICNDRPSYVPTKRAFTEGSYEVTNARVKSGVGEMLVESATELLKKLK